MTGLYPGITERLETYLETYCTRQVRRDHPCSNALSCQKMIGSLVSLELHSDVPCQEPPLLRIGLKVIPPIQQHAVTSLQEGNSWGCVYPAGSMVPALSPGQGGDCRGPQDQEQRQGHAEQPAARQRTHLSSLRRPGDIGVG